MNIEIKKATKDDINSIFSLYQKVAEEEGGIARKKDEISKEYISAFANKSLINGIIFIAADEITSNVVGEIHCYSPEIEVFNHVLNELTIAVDPDYQGKGIGRCFLESC
jgi:N-acetylglutamate synthase-like GNAT family acetyltransferase